MSLEWDPPRRRNKRPEGNVSDAIDKAVAKLGWAALYRNHVEAGEINGHYIQAGLCKGSGDRIGWLTLKSGIAVFLSVECKRPKGGVISPAQEAWHRKVTAAGGLSILGAKSAAEVVEALVKFREEKG